MDFELKDGHIIAVPEADNGVVLVNFDGAEKVVREIEIDGVSEEDRNQAVAGNLYPLTKYIEVDPDGAQCFVGCVGRVSLSPAEHCNKSTSLAIREFREFVPMTPHPKIPPPPSLPLV